MTPSRCSLSRPPYARPWIRLIVAMCSDLKGSPSLGFPKAAACSAQSRTPKSVQTQDWLLPPWQEEPPPNALRSSPLVAQLNAPVCPKRLKASLSSSSLSESSFGCALACAAQAGSAGCWAACAAHQASGVFGMLRAGLGRSGAGFRPPKSKAALRFSSPRTSQASCTARNLAASPVGLSGCHTKAIFLWARRMLSAGASAGKPSVL
mmetsp:Transcript_93783/g.292240  ORF Transcript_93783/g.292240 Transcript_93783/m.292240 type:complete len:207 (+) Transcript_93783:279-899(+)